MSARVVQLVRHVVPVVVLALAALPAAAQGYSDALFLIDPQGGVARLLIQESDEQPGVFFVVNLPGDPGQVGNPTALVEV